MGKKDIVMNSAFKLFLEKGFSSVSNSEIIKDSNVGPGTIYYHFKNKDDIILSVMDKYILQMYIERLNIIKSFKGDSFDTLSFLYKQLNGYDSEVNPYFVPIGSEDSYPKLLLLACEGIQKYKTVSYRYNEFYDELILFINEYIEKGKKSGEIRDDITTKELSYLIQTNLNGIFHMLMILKNIPLEEIIDFNLKHVWNYIKK